MKDSNWIEILTNPIGLASFTVAVVFGAIATKGKTSKGMKYVALGLAAVGITGGLIVSFYSASSSTAEEPASALHVNNSSVTQHTDDEASPNVANVNGNVIINSPGSAKK